MSTTPPGWYDDQTGTGTERWWDGSTWTQQTRRAPAPVTEVYPQQAPASSHTLPFPAGVGHGRPTPKRGKGKTVLLVLAAVVGVFVVVAVISSLAGGGPSSPSTASGAAAGESDGESPTEESQEAPQRAEDNPAWGQTVTFDDNSTLTCSKPVKFKRAEFAVGGEESKVLLKSRCTFVNGSDEVFEPALTTASMTAGDTEGESVYQEGLDAPDNPVRPGKKVTWWMGYGVPSAKDVQLTVELGFLDYPGITFSN